MNGGANQQRVGRLCVDWLGLVRVCASGKWWGVQALMCVWFWRLAQCLPKPQHYCRLGLVSSLLWGDRPVPWGTHPWTLPTRCLLPSYGNQGRLQMLPRAP